MTVIPQVSDSGRDRRLGLVLSTIVMAAFIVFIFVPPSRLSPVTLPIVRFLAATAAALAAYLFIGSMIVTGQLPVTSAKIQVKAGGAFAVFIVVFLLFFWGLPKAETKTDAERQERSIAPAATLAAPVSPKMQSFAETVSLGENDTAVVHNLIIRTGSIGISDSYFADVAVGNSSRARVHKGEEIAAYHEDCDSLKVLVKDIQLEIPPGMSMEDLRKMGRAAEALVHRKITLIVEGRCAKE